MTLRAAQGAALRILGEPPDYDGFDAITEAEVYGLFGVEPGAQPGPAPVTGSRPFDGSAIVVAGAGLFVVLVLLVILGIVRRRRGRNTL